MSNALGSLHTLGFKPQATAGTAETTVTTFLSTRSLTMRANPRNIERKSSAGTGRPLPSRKGYIAPDGKAVCDVMASQPQPWYWALGHNHTTTPAGTVRLHTITEEGGPVNLTAEGDRVYDKCKQGDAKISKIRLIGQAGEDATLEIEWMSLTHTDGATLTSTPTYVTDQLTCRAAILKIDGTQDKTIESYEIEYVPGLEQLPTLEDVDGAPHVIRRKTMPTVNGKLKFIDYPTAEFVKMRNATAFAFIAELDGDVIEAAYKKFLRITLPACQYVGGLDGDIASDVITGEADFAAYHDTVTGNQILVEAQNTISSIVA